MDAPALSGVCRAYSWMVLHSCEAACCLASPSLPHPARCGVRGLERDRGLYARVEAGRTAGKRQSTPDQRRTRARARSQAPRGWGAGACGC